MKLDGRTVTTVLAAVVVALVVGAIAGTTHGAAAGAVGALASLLAGACFWVATEMWHRNITLENRRQEVLRRFAPRELTASPPVAHFLWPEEAVVPFRPRPELDELMAWCVSGGHAAVRLVTGDAGAGKTRLARQLHDELALNGWQPLWVPRDSEGDAIRSAHTAGQPCVLVVDYAETRSGLTGLLNALAVVAGLDPDGTLRLLVSPSKVDVLRVRRELLAERLAELHCSGSSSGPVGRVFGRDLAPSTGPDPRRSDGMAH